MPRLRLILVFSAMLFLSGIAICIPAESKDKPSQPQASSLPDRPLSNQSRLNIIRALNAEFVFIRKPFPMGTKGLVLKDGVITPSDSELNFMVAQYGLAARPGDRAQISDVVIKDHSIIFEINGGPKKKKKWYQHIEVGGMGGMTPVAPDNNPQNPRGSFVALVFDHHVPEVTPEQLKKMLTPIFDFSSLSAAQAYADTLPPKAREAVKKHEVLVGMNKEMVIASVGRPQQKVREHDERGEYEEWIYGEPPQEMQFIRLYGDEVGQVKIMKVTGEKIVRTQREIEVAQSGMAQPQKPAGSSTQEQGGMPAPTLRRPGEVDPNAAPSSGSTPVQHAPGPEPQTPPESSPDPSIPHFAR